MKYRWEKCQSVGHISRVYWEIWYATSCYSIFIDVRVGQYLLKFSPWALGVRLFKNEMAGHKVDAKLRRFLKGLMNFLTTEFTS